MPYIDKDEFIKAECNSCDGACECVQCDAINCRSEYRCDIIQHLMEFPTVDAIEVVRCKDCKYFALNSWANVNGIPLIVAHEICTRWGEGCKTSEDGYCFMAERKETEDE